VGQQKKGERKRRRKTNLSNLSSGDGPSVLDGRLDGVGVVVETLRLLAIDEELLVGLANKGLVALLVRRDLEVREGEAAKGARE
jgi:hypothetical protein